MCLKNISVHAEDDCQPCGDQALVTEPENWFIIIIKEVGRSNTLQAL